MSDNDPWKFFELYQRTVHKYNRFEEQKRYYNTDIQITAAEIHTIDAIGSVEAINLINLSKKLGITRGSASQMIYKLVDKNLVSKTASPNSDREILITLTEKGKQAYEGHRRMHKESGRKIKSTLMDIDPEVLNAAMTYLERFEACLDELLQE